LKVILSFFKSLLDSSRRDGEFNSNIVNREAARKEVMGLLGFKESSELKRVDLLGAAWEGAGEAGRGEVAAGIEVLAVALFDRFSVGRLVVDS